MKESI